MEKQQRSERNNWGRCRPERDRSNSWQEGLTDRIQKIIQNDQQKESNDFKEQNFTGVEVKSWLH